MQLYVLRHGRAVDAAEWKGSEFERPLTAQGRRRMEREAKTIGRLIAPLERIVTSPLVRASETAAIVAQELGISHRLIEDERLGPGFSVERLRAILAPFGASRAIMIVGHEPALGATIGAVAGGTRVVMKKGGLARIDLHDLERLEGELLWLAPPKVLLASGS